MPLFLKVISTGSKGNCYILRGIYGESLIIDAGVPIKKVLPHIPDMYKINGCLVSHEHNDHSKAIKDYDLRGIKVLTSTGTWKALGYDRQGIEAMKPVKLKHFTVMPFDVQHDAEQPFGFLIRYEITKETFLYVTDTYYLKYLFPGVNFWLIECNYCDDLLNDETDKVLKNRLKESHMSLRRLKDALSANDLTDTEKIIICHLSDQRSNEQQMVSEINELTGIDTIAATDGMNIELSLTPF